MHPTLKKETTRPPASNSLQQQAGFDPFRKKLNAERPTRASPWPADGSACIAKGSTSPPFSAVSASYATVARGFGVHGEGPITDPKDLGPALLRAIATVKS